MQKGYKRTGKAIAVLHFFIGLIVVAIFLVAAYFCLEKMDYSHRINPDTTVRAYVEMTASPDDFGMSLEASSPDGLDSEGFDSDGFDSNGFDPEGGESNVVDLIPTASPTPLPTLEPTATPIPTAIPTPSPTPTATPVPTPEPTIIPSDLLSRSRTRGFKVPDPSRDATAALTNIYVSEPNNRTIAQVDGYAFINDAEIDAAETQAYLIVTPSEEGNGTTVAYLAAMTPGVSGVTHDGAQCQNPANADFEVLLSVADFEDGVYKMGVVLQYRQNGRKTYTYYEFSETLTVEGEAISAASSPQGSGASGLSGIGNMPAAATFTEQSGGADYIGADFGGGADFGAAAGDDGFGDDMADDDFADDIGGDMAGDDFGDDMGDDSFGTDMGEVSTDGASVSVG